MRILEIIRESVEEEQGENSLISDINYLLRNGDVTPSTLKSVHNFVNKQFKKFQDVPSEPFGSDQQPAPDQLAEPVQHPQAQQSQAPEQTVAEPQKFEPEEGDDDEEQQVFESFSRAGVIADINSKMKHLPDQELQKVRYFLDLTIFHPLVSQIVKGKIKVKATAIDKELKRAITDLNGVVTSETMLDFLNDCLYNGGVINAAEMVSGASEDTAPEPIPITKDEYKPIIKRMLEASLSSASASGKGEFGLAFAGIGATKGAHDITIGENEVEVKATHSSSDFFFKGQTGFSGSSTRAGLELLITALNSAGANFAKKNKTSEGGIAQVNPTTLNNINQYFQVLGPDKTSEILINTVEKIYSDKRTDITEFEPDIIAAVNEDGSVDYNMLSIATSKIAFSYYQQLEKHDGILMLNLDELTYKYVTNASYFSDLVAANVVKPTSVLDFRTSSKGSLTFKLQKM